jgi:hypothetical protein
MTVASCLSVKVLRHSGLRVAFMSPSPGCYGNPNQRGQQAHPGQDINVKVPHAFMALMNGQSHKCLTSSQMAHYQGLRCENP